MTISLSRYKYCPNALKSITLWLLLALINQSGESRDWKDPKPLAGINTPKDEYAPFIHRDSLVYFSREGTEKKILYSNDSLKRSLQESKERSTAFSQIEAHYITEFGGNLLVGSLRDGSRQDYMNIGLSRFSRNAYQKAYFIDSLLCDCYCSHPTYSRANQILAFTSNRINNNPNDTDIWLINESGNPSMGGAYNFDLINTPYRETSPHFSGDTLFFASEGLGGQGGLDLFYTILDNGIWSRPVPLEVNSEYDEYDPFVSADGTLYFVSERPGGQGGSDIYFAKASIEDTPTESIDLELKGYVSKVTIKRTDKYISIPLPTELSSDSPESDSFDLSLFDIENSNMLVKAITDYAISDDRTHLPLKITAYLPNELETESKQNTKYYLDKRITNLYNEVSLQISREVQYPLNINLESLFAIEYMIGEAGKSRLPNPVILTKKDLPLTYKIRNSTYSSEPSNLAFGLEYEAEKNYSWEIKIADSDKSFIGAGNRPPESPIEYAIPNIKSIFDGSNSDLIIVAKITDGNERLIGSDGFTVTLNRRTDLIYDFEEIEYGYKYQVYLSDDLRKEDILPYIKDLIGGRLMAASSVGIVTKESQRTKQYPDIIKQAFADSGLSSNIFIDTRAKQDTLQAKYDWLYRLEIMIPKSIN
jgi:hypothetical protein